MSEELYKKYRPKKFSDIVGQPDAVKMLIDMGRRKAVPHCLLFTGPSGVGKTTMIRILREKLKCGDIDYKEINAAKDRGIDVTRDIDQRMGLAPIGGKCRVWAVDEAARLTGDAQSSFLKMLEDTPKHVYFMLATTDPQKLLPTIRTRSTVIALRALSPVDLAGLVRTVCESEGVEITEDVADKLADVADGSARKVLVLLHAIIGLDGEEAQLEAIDRGDTSRQAIELARALVNPKARWNEVAAILKGIEGLDNDAESIRWLVLSYMATVAIKNSRMAARACFVIECFADNFYDSKRAGLVLSCYEAVSGSD